MRGRPDPPDDVAQVKAVFSVNGWPATVAWWLFVPELQALAIPQLEALIATFTFELLPFTSSCTHAGCKVARVELTRWGTSPLHLVRDIVTNQGAWTGGQSLVNCSVLAWLTGEGGRGRTGLTHLPGFPDAFSDDGRSLNVTGFADLSTAAPIFLAGVNAIVSPSGAPCVLGTLHFSAGGAPLPAATFAPIIGVRVSQTLGTLDRRRIGSGGVSSAP